jgi:hypothetical protein
MEIQANPDIEQLKIILWIAGPLILVMLGVIGYFIKQQVDASKAIADVVQQLNILVTELRTQNELLNPVFERRLNHHSESIEGHERRLTVIETEHHINHKLRRNNEKVH